MLKTGELNDLVVKRQTEGRYFLEADEGEIPLICDTRGKGIKPGDTLTVFIYTDTSGDPVATLTHPTVTVNQFANLKVVDVNKFGAYLDWGIEKDLFVYRKEQARPMKMGNSYVVLVRRDRFNGKIQGTSLFEEWFDADTSHFKKGEKVSILVYAISEIGIMAIVNRKYSGMLYINETFKKLVPGDEGEAYIKKVREDGKLDLTLQANIKEAISDSQRVVLEELEKAGGFLPYHDKSDPEEIKRVFNMSKKNFKRAIGGLYKDRRIHLAKNGIGLS